MTLAWSAENRIASSDICTWTLLVKLMHFRSWKSGLVELVTARKRGCVGWASAAAAMSTILTTGQMALGRTAVCNQRTTRDGFLETLSLFD